ncbi:hypothetical protein [Primorskyibacter sp. S87]|uniref:hypothetical protein n=1 Tax=Primorskyibacter sp. S87 TaxID=3415126 RepID=UPI003C7DE5A9
MLQDYVTDIRKGVRNLLFNCAGASTGDRVLLAYEPSRLGYFDRDIVRDVSEHARQLGMSVEAQDVGYSPQSPGLSGDLLGRLDQFDVVVFLSRLGDQLRFSNMPEGPKFVICFTLNSQLLGSSFGTSDYRGFVELKSLVDRHLIAASQITLTCPAGTFVEGRAPANTARLEDTSSVRFPLSVFSPVPAAGFSGRVALGGFLTGTGSRYYEDYTTEFEGQVFAVLEQGRLTGFDGPARDVALANAQYDRVAGLFGIDRNFVHSWHAGIHPGCGFPWPLKDNFERWGGSAFGNPRILHFHTCGAYAPGEISWNTFDPDIDIDGTPVWENGHFHPERLPGGAEILTRYPNVVEVFEDPDRNIGLNDHI